MANKFLSGINVTGTTTLNTVANAGTDTDKFLVLDASGNVDFRTGDEVYADLGIGSLPAGFTSTLKHAVKAGVALTKGQAVYVTSADGTNMIVGKASNASEATSSKTLGLIETSLSNNGIGNVITEGLLAGLDTTGATNAGDPVWLGTDGNLIYGLLNKPYAPAHLVFIGVVTRRNANNGEIFVKVQNGFELNEIHDVDLKTTTPIDGHILGYNGTLWVNKTIAGWLGYTPADDSSVVKLSGAQTVGGLKTFSASIIANIGVLLKNGAVSALSGYTAIGGSSSNNGIDIALNTSGYTQSLLFQTGASYAYTFPAATGTVALTSNLSAYVPTSRTITINGTSYDLSADRSWTVTSMVYPSAGIAVSTGTAWGTSITDNSSNWNTAYGWGNHASAGYVPGARELTINGTTYDLTANRSWTIDATSVSTRTIQKFTSTASQTTFTITGGYAVGMVDVWVNGVKLDNATEFTASNGTTVVLSAGLTADQIVEVYKYGSQFIANNALRQKTLFTATAGQTTFTVAYSVGLVDVFYNGSKLDDSEYTATNGTSIVFGTACAVNDKVEVIAYSYNVNGFTGIGGSGTTNYIPKFTASGTIGNSLIFDNGTNVGIGTTSPNSKLQLNGTDLTSFTSTSYAPLFLQGGTYTGSQVQAIDFGSSSYTKPLVRIGARIGSAGSSLQFGTSNAYTTGITNTAMTINENGFIGMGTSSPARPLHVAGTTDDTYVRTSNNGGGVQFGVTVAGNGIFETINSTGSTLFWNGGSERFKIGSVNSRNAEINTNGNVVQSFISQPGNVGNGGTCSITIQQVQYEWETSYIYDIVGLYAPSGTNVRAFATGIAHFFTDGGANDNNVATITATGWSVSSNSNNSGTFNIVFTNNSGYTQNNINIRVLKINRMN